MEWCSTEHNGKMYKEARIDLEVDVQEKMGKPGFAGLAEADRDRKPRRLNSQVLGQGGLKLRGHEACSLCLCRSTFNL